MLTFLAVVSFISNACSFFHSFKIVIYEYIHEIFRLVLQKHGGMIREGGLTWRQVAFIPLLFKKIECTIHVKTLNLIDLWSELAHFLY